MSESKANLKKLREQRKQFVAQKNWQEAIKISKQMITIEPSADRYTNLGILQTKNKLYSQAIESFNQALLLEPDFEKALEGIKKANLKQKKLAKNEHIESNTQLLLQDESDIENLFAKEEEEEGSKVFGRYQISEEIGQGGMGKVYKAYDPQLKRHIALKTLLQNENTKLIERFVKETEAMAQLIHPNIVRIYDIGKENNQNYFTMDFIEGESLATLIHNKKLTLKKSLVLIKKIALTMDFAHSKGIIHRDLKPSNIMINKEQQPIVMDFGLAVVIEQETRLSQTGDAIGTPAYMAKEQVLGQKGLMDQRTDVYALGVILYEMLTGMPPFSGSVPYLVMQQVIEKEPTPPIKINKNISEKLNSVCLKAMAKDRDKRYASAKAFAVAIEQKRQKAKKINTGFLYFAVLLSIISILFFVNYPKSKKNIPKATEKLFKTTSDSVKSFSKNLSSKITQSSLKKSSKGLSKTTPNSAKKPSKSLSSEASIVKKSSKSLPKAMSNSVKKSSQKSLQTSKANSKLLRYKNFAKEYPSLIKKRQFDQAIKQAEQLDSQKKEPLIRDLKNCKLLVAKLHSFFSKTNRTIASIPLKKGTFITGKLINKKNNKLVFKQSNNKYTVVSIKDIKTKFLGNIIGNKKKDLFYLGMLLLVEGDFFYAKKYLRKSKSNRAKNLLKQVNLFKDPKITANIKKQSLTVPEEQSTMQFDITINSQTFLQKVVFKKNKKVLLHNQNKKIQIAIPLDYGENKIQLEVYTPFKILSMQNIAIYNKLEQFTFKWKIKRSPPKKILAQSTYRNNFQRTGHFTKGLAKEPKVKWQKSFPLGTLGSPVLHKGVLYLGTLKGLHAINAETGSLLWGYIDAGGYIYPPSIANNSLYFGCADGHVYALDIEKKKRKWRYKTGSVTFSPLVENNSVYFSSAKGNFYAVNAQNGHLRWKRSKTINQQYSSFPVTLKNLVYWHNGKTLYALYKKNGNVKWSFKKSYAWGMAVSNKTVCIAAIIGVFYALDANTGKIRWEFDLGSNLSSKLAFSAPAIANGIVYYSCSDGYLYALSLYNGKLLWKKRTSKKIPISGALIWKAPAIAENIVYCGNYVNKSFYALSAKTGNFMWQYNLKYISPFIDKGTMYLCADSVLYALH